MDTAFNDIRQSAAGNTAVMVRLLEGLGILARTCTNTEHRRAIAKHADMVERSVAEFIFDPNDKSDAEERMKAVRRALARPC